MTRPEMHAALGSIDETLARIGVPFEHQHRHALREFGKTGIDTPKPTVWLVTARHCNANEPAIEIPMLLNGGIAQAAERAIKYVEQLNLPYYVDSVRRIGFAVEVKS